MSMHGTAMAYITLSGVTIMHCLEGGILGGGGSFPVLGGGGFLQEVVG